MLKDSATAAEFFNTREWHFSAITTRNRPERRRRAELEFARLGLDVDLLVADPPLAAAGFASAGVRGCFLSHLACLRNARDSGARIAVVAEDDVVISSRFIDLSRVIDEELSGLSWSMLYLGYLPEQSPARGESMQLITRHVGRCTGWEVRGSHFYAVSADALDGLIEDFEQRLRPGGHRIPADGVLNEYRRDNGIDTLVCVPNLARQAPSPSGITVGDDLRSRVKNHILSRQRSQQMVERTKRLMLNVSSTVPTAVHVRRWNSWRRTPNG
jgi:GR25 family glycosyltransferase involved in LPS biosynthesis